MSQLEFGALERVQVFMDGDGGPINGTRKLFLVGQQHYLFTYD